MSKRRYWLSESKKYKYFFVGALTGVSCLFIVSYLWGWYWMALVLLWSLVSWKLAKNKEEYKGRKTFVRIYQFDWHIPLILSSVIVVIYLILMRAFSLSFNPRVLLALVTPSALVTAAKYFWLESKLCYGLAMDSPIEESHGKVRNDKDQEEPPTVSYWSAVVVKSNGNSGKLLFTSKEGFLEWYNQPRDWSNVEEIKLTEEEGESPGNLLQIGNKVQNLIGDIRRFNPKWEIRTDRSHGGRIRSLVGEEKGTSRNLSDFLVKRGWDSRVEATIQGYGRADILVGDRYLIEAKNHIAEPGPRRDLGSKARRLIGTNYYLIIIVYMGCLDSHIRELEKELEGTEYELVVLGNWYENVNI